MPKSPPKKTTKAKKTPPPESASSAPSAVAPPLLSIAAISGPKFFTRPDSPFADRYDLDAEREAIKDLYEADEPDESDSRYPRLLEVWDREDQLKKLQTFKRLRNHADPIVSDEDANRISVIGKLVSADTDTMTLHTKDAYRMFMGRERDGSNPYGAVAGKRCAAAFRAVWLLSGNDNPYADWVLVEMAERIDAARKTVQSTSKNYEIVLTKLRERGLSYSVHKSANPVTVDLGFQSPYGYMIAEMIVDYDYLARVVRTLEAKDKLTRKEATQALYQAKKPIRSVFETLIPFQRMLQRPELLPMSRKDWASNEVLAKQRVTFAVQCFGECPRDVFTGAKTPRHTRRRAQVDPNELAFLESVPLDGVTQVAGTDEVTLI